MKPFIISNFNSVFRAISLKIIQNTITQDLLIKQQELDLVMSIPSAQVSEKSSTVIFIRNTGVLSAILGYNNAI